MRMRRCLVLALAAACGAPSHPGGDEDDRFNPQLLTSSAFCLGDARVDRVDRVSVCHDGSAQRYWTATRRGAAGWVSSRGDTFELDQTTRLDADLAAGVRTLCGGDGNLDVPYPSLHRADLGWPMFECFPSPELVLYRGDDTVVLPVPLGRDLAEAYFIIGVHDFGKRADFDDAGD